VKLLGVDLIDCSSGGNVAGAAIPLAPGYQVQFAEKIPAWGRIATGAVGLIRTPGKPTRSSLPVKRILVLLARELLRDPTGRSAPRWSLSICPDPTPVRRAF
jgi:2,4-dienoyl-CoA reductase-like NADH-dependent reductase (Old Yellow Enzyme family)